MVRVRANSITEAIRREGMSFIHRAEDRVGGQVQLARQGWMEVDAEPAVRPVVEEGVRIQQCADIAARTGPPGAVPTTGRTCSGCTCRRARPRSGRSLPWSARGPRALIRRPGASPAFVSDCSVCASAPSRSGAVSASWPASGLRLTPSDNSAVFINSVLPAGMRITR